MGAVAAAQIDGLIELGEQADHPGQDGQELLAIVADPAVELLERPGPDGGAVRQHMLFRQACRQKFMLIGRRRLRQPSPGLCTPIRPLTWVLDGGVNSCGTEIASPDASFFSAS